MQLTEHLAKDMLATLGLEDIPIVEYMPKSCSLDSNWFQKYVKIRREFLTSLTDSIEEISFMNLTQDEFINMLMGKSLPENTSVRFKIPLIWGGEIKTENMFLCWTFPHSFNIDRFLIAQNDAKTVYLPNPEKKIYLSTHLGGGGDGGNATSDRLSQSVYNFMTERGNE